MPYSSFITWILSTSGHLLILRILRRLLYNFLAPDMNFRINQAIGEIKIPKRFLISLCIPQGGVLLHQTLATRILTQHPIALVPPIGKFQTFVGYGYMVSTRDYEVSARRLLFLHETPLPALRGYALKIVLSQGYAFQFKIYIYKFYLKAPYARRRLEEGYVVCCFFTLFSHMVSTVATRQRLNYERKRTWWLELDIIYSRVRSVHSTNDAVAPQITYYDDLLRLSLWPSNATWCNDNHHQFCIAVGARDFKERLKILPATLSNETMGFQVVIKTIAKIQLGNCQALSTQIRKLEGGFISTEFHGRLLISNYYIFLPRTSCLDTISALHTQD